ncbi:MAG: hypothetical protein ACPHVY_03675, partial [Candidatus Puniceispirillaceae bacterium]
RAAHERAVRKAGAIYEVIDQSGGFYGSPVVVHSHRSLMNVPFNVGGGERAATVEECHLAEQRIFAGGKWHDGTIIDRLRLPEGAVVSGPCLLVQPDATIYVDPGLSARVDRIGNVIIDEER